MSPNARGMTKMIEKYEAFFFDFDGVIVDSLKIKGEAFGSLFAEYGPEVVRKVMDYHYYNGGVSRYEKFRYFYKEFLGKEITSEMVQELDKTFSCRVTEKVVTAPEIKGVADFILRLNKVKRDCFIVSATPQEEMLRIAALRGIDGMFREITGSPRKKEENLKYLLEKYLIPPSKAVFFGDAKSDHSAACQNNVAFVGVVGDENSELKGIEGITKIRDFRELVSQGAGAGNE